MSDNSNTNIMERASNLIDELTSHPSRADVLLEQAIDRNDLEELKHLVTKYEGLLSEEHFHAHNILEPNDVF